MDDVTSLLVIRRDNIGDLVCTTPLLTALRARYPRAWIGVLANSYNAPVLDRNPDVDEIFAYRKLKHLAPGQGSFEALAGRISMLWTLRRRKLDLVILAAGAQDTRGARLAGLLAPARILQSRAAEPGEHEVERTFSAARLLGIGGPIPPLRVSPSATAVTGARQALRLHGLDLEKPIVGVHISARRASQRWPAARFAELIQSLHRATGAGCVLLWSPGGEDHPQHPGDDGKAADIASCVANNAPLAPLPTNSLADLVGALSACDAVLCSDGGAMHLAAGLAKPIACFFGDSPVSRWRPWGVKHTVLQAPGGRVEDVPVDTALNAVQALLQDLAAPPGVD